ncbi:endolytic transglycosylase MltG, partial [Aerococcus urinae]
AHNEHSTYVTIEDTMIDSPYNLYQNTGLGPGPFNNPSESAIQAALNPTPNDYMYFVADLSTGNVYFSKTYEEHDQLVQEYVSPEDAKLQEQ